MIYIHINKKAAKNMVQMQIVQLQQVLHKLLSIMSLTLMLMRLQNTKTKIMF